MPYKEKPVEKIFYTIGEVAAMLNVNTSHIRFWSKQFDVIKPSTNRKGNRLFTPGDVENFKIIYHLVKEKGFTLKGAKVEMKMMRKKMRIEQNPEVSKVETTDNALSQPPLEINTGEITEKIALAKSLEKIKSSLLDIQKSLNSLVA